MTLALDYTTAYTVGACIEAVYRLFKPGLLAPAASDALLPAGWRVGAELTAIDRIAGRSEPEFFGLALQSAAGSDVLFALRGTDTLLEWLVDAEFGRCAFPCDASAGHVEDGFCGVYSTLRCSPGSDPLAYVQALAPGTSVTIAGHSLGAAVATLLAADFAVRAPHVSLTLFTYASPRVGDAAFAAFCDAHLPVHYRIVNAPDMVPRVPPLYDHCGTEFEVDSRAYPSIAHSLACYHTLTTYLWLLNQQSTFGLGECGRAGSPA